MQSEPSVRERGKWTGLLIEGLVILASILIAFFLEGWGNERELRREVRQELASVQRELERNQQLVRLELTSLGRIVPAGAEITRLMDAARGQATVGVVDTLAWLATGWNVTFSPSLGAVSALIESGRLAQVEDSELRLGLAGLRDVISDAIEDEVGAREVNSTQVLPLIGSTYPLDFGIGNELYTSGGEGLTSQERIATRPLESRGLVDFPTALAARNAIAHRMAWLVGAQGEFDRLHRYLGDLITLISAEME